VVPEGGGGRRRVDLVQTVRPRRNGAPPTARPSDLDLYHGVPPGRKRKFGVASGEVIAGRHHLARLDRQRWRAHRHGGADAGDVRRGPAESHGNRGAVVWVR
jgi:hypothetical protein